MRGVQQKTKISDDSNNFTFNALRGIQGGREYYVVMCPLKWIPSIFRFNEPEIPPELRSQRVLNKARIPEITSYLVNNHQEYVFSSLTASIDGDVEFVPAGKNGGSLKMGKLLVPMDSRFLINDGQHRRAAIEEAIKRKPELELETISVVFYLDRGLKNSQQMFSDLNKYAIRPTKSLNILYNNRDDFSTAVKDMLSHVPIFNGRTDLEKTSISNRTDKVFTLNSIFAANKALLGKNDKNPKIDDNEKKLAIEFWNQIYGNIKEWQEVVEGKITPYELRKDYVHVQGILLHAIGIMGHDLIQKYPKTWKSKLKFLQKIDWKRSNRKDWEGRAMISGKLSKSHRNIILTGSFLKKKVGLPLTSKEKGYEKGVKNSK